MAVFRRLVYLNYLLLMTFCFYVHLYQKTTQLLGYPANLDFELFKPNLHPPVESIVRLVTLVARVLLQTEAEQQEELLKERSTHLGDF